jgi:putative ABC transport system substrate-binding protein
MVRRTFLGTLTGGFLARPLTIRAQQARSDTSPVHVGILGYSTGVLPHPRNAFRAKLAEFGYVSGQNLVIDKRYANGRRDRVPGFGAELIALDARVLVVVGPYVVKIAKGIAGA